MKMLDYAYAAAWKHGNAPGIRFFENPARPAKLGITNAVPLGDFAVVWPESLGSPPTLEKLEQWVAEWKVSKYREIA